MKQITIGFAFLFLATQVHAFHVWIQGDTQKMVESSGGSNVVHLGGLTRGLCEIDRNLSASGDGVTRIIHVGDIVQLYYSTVQNTSSGCTVCTEWYGQWERASGAYDISDACGIAGSYVLGNHDLKSQPWSDAFRAHWWRLAFHGSTSSPLRNYGSGPNYWFTNAGNDPASAGGVDTTAIHHVAGDYFAVVLPFAWTAEMLDWVVDTIASQTALQGKKFIVASHATVYPPAFATTEHDPTAGSPMRMTTASANVVARLEDPVAQGGAAADVVAVAGGHFRPNVDLDIKVPFAWDVEPSGSYVRIFANAQTLATGGAGWGVFIEIDESTGELCVWDEDVVFDEGTLGWGGSQLCATPN